MMRVCPVSPALSRLNGTPAAIEMTSVSGRSAPAISASTGEITCGFTHKTTTCAQAAALALSAKARTPSSATSASSASRRTSVAPSCSLASAPLCTAPHRSALAMLPAPRNA
jgi:hypothetical protein